jgi:hypothetical protein
LLIFCIPNLYTPKVSLELTLNEANITNDPCIFIFRSLRYFQNLTKLNYHTRCSLIWSYFDILISVRISAYQRCSVRLFLWVVVRGNISYLCCLLYFAYWCHTWLYVYHGGCLVKGRKCVLFASIWVHPRLLMGSMFLIFLVFCLVHFCIVCLRTVCCVPNGCPFLTAPSGFSNFKQSLVILYRRSVQGIPWTHLYYRIGDMVPRSAIFHILPVIFIGGRNRSTRRNTSICRKSLTNFTT